MLYFDQTYQLQYSQLLRVDKMMMAHSVEARVPYLYESVANAADGLSDRHKVKMHGWQRGRDNKIALAKAFSRNLPAAIVERPKFGAKGTVNLWHTPLFADLERVGRGFLGSSRYKESRDVLSRWIDWEKVASSKLPPKQVFSLSLMIATVGIHLCGAERPADASALKVA
jgi:asparagine synthase (glutamine-hydrolysing)